MLSEPLKFLRPTVWLTAMLLLCGCASLRHSPEASSHTAESIVTRRYVLHADRQISLNAPGFQASGLLQTTTGDLLTINDRGPTLYRVAFRSGAHSAEVVPVTDCFTASQVAPFTPQPPQHLDCEGIAQDPLGRLYICEEGQRWILRCDPASGTVERLSVDWTPVAKSFSSDGNASFEGIAIGDGKLYVANERSDPLIIVVDLTSLRIIDSFVIQPLTPSFLGILHYSDLSWHNGHLFVLCRHHRVVLEADPATHQVLAEYDYREIEDSLGYRTRYPTGLMEGLAVDDNTVWLVTDNNGLPRANGDTRPTLIHCPRLDLTSAPASQFPARSTPASAHVR